MLETNFVSTSLELIMFQIQNRGMFVSRVCELKDDPVYTITAEANPSEP